MKPIATPDDEMGLLSIQGEKRKHYIHYVSRNVIFLNHSKEFVNNYSLMASRYTAWNHKLHKASK